MKQKIKKTAIILGGLLLLVVLLFAGLNLRMAFEQRTMHPMATSHLDSTLSTVLDGKSNLYLLRTSQGYIAIDAGNDSTVVSEGLRSLGIDASQVHTVLLTHSDGDHVNGLRAFPNAKVYLAAQETQLLDGRTYRFLIFGNTIPGNKYTILPQQKLDLQGTIVQTIPLPGHTPGHVGFLVDDNRLFIGDAASLRNGEIAPFNALFEMDKAVATESRKKIMEFRKARTIYSSHYGII